MSLDLTEILEALITLLFVIATGYLIPFIKAKVSKDRLNEIMVWIKTAVHAAEQIYKGTSRGREKKEYVLKFLKDKGIKLDEESIEMLIESTVLELNKAIEQEVE